MQNWNQWQLPATGIAAPMPPTPAGYAAPGADPMAMMQSYMQYYNQPAPSGYTNEQWSTAQQQNWAQWQQWQQQFQQWQAQYGEKYQETMKQFSSQGLTLPSVTNQAPPLPTVQQPPLPKEDNTKPPLPPDNSQYSFGSVPPPHQNNLPLFPSKQGFGYNSSNAPPPLNIPNFSQNPPLPPGQPPLPDHSGAPGGKRGNHDAIDSGSAKKTRVEDEELTEAEKTFDAQFKQWEEQFNKWKQQNANHPDKSQYKQYEAKWTSWREKLIERREQMRKKREQQKQATVKAEVEKNKNLPGGDKILNILSSTENQGLINNLLGIGKTLGLTGKQDAAKPSTQLSLQPPLPPPSTSIAPPMPPTIQPQPTQQAPMQQPPVAGMVPPTMTTDMTQAAWAAQQWAAQYNANMAIPNQGIPNYSGFQQMPSQAVAIQPGQVTNYTQPPPNLPNSAVNFSQPPPGFGGGDSRQAPGVKHNQGNNQDRPPFGPDGDKRDNYGGNDQYKQGNDRFGSANSRFGPGNDSFGREGPNSEFGSNDRGSGNQFSSGNDRFGTGSDHFTRDSQSSNFGPNDRAGNHFIPGGSERFARNDRFGSNDQRDPSNNRFRKDSDNFPQDNERFGSNDRAQANNRFSRDNEAFSIDNDRYGTDKDRFGSGNDRFGVGNDRFGPGNERFGLGADKDNFNQSSGFNKDNFGSGSDRFGRNDRFGQINLDRFESRDHNLLGDNRRDGFSDNTRGFNRNTRQNEPQDDIAPELKKLMEKRRAALDVFKPRDDVFNPDKKMNIGSLSESFKKISDLSYASRSSGDFGLRGLLGSGPGGMDYFRPRGPGDFGPRGPGALSGANSFSLRGPRPEFGPRGPGMDKFGPRGDFGGPRGTGPFGSRGMGDFGCRGRDAPILDHPGDFGPRGRDGINMDQPEDFGQKGPKIDLLEGFEARDLDNSVEKGPDRPLEFRQDNQDSIQDGFGKRESNEPQKAIQKNLNAPVENIPPLERPPWMDAQFPEENSNEKLDNNVEKQPLINDSVSVVPEKPDKTIIQREEPTVTPFMEINMNEENIQKEKIETNEIPQMDLPQVAQPIAENESNQGKNTNVLPFMGENDPKPEDLNMEPPPELPNLGPIIGGPNTSHIAGSRSPHNAPFSLRGSLGPSGPNFGQAGPFGAPYGPGRINAGFFGPRGPFEGRFGPRGPNDSPFGPRGPNDIPFGPRGPIDSSFGPRGLMQFGPRGPNNDLRFSSFGPKCLNEGLLGARPNNLQLGSLLGSAPFGLRGPNDSQFGNRPQNHPPFGPRGIGDNLFRPRGPNDGNFGPRGLSDGPRSGIPSLLGIPYDSQHKIDEVSGAKDALNQGKDFGPAGDQERPPLGLNPDERHVFAGNETDQNPFDKRAPFTQGGPDQRQPFVQGGLEQRQPFPKGGPEQRQPFSQSGPEQRPPFSQSSLEQRPPFVQGSPEQRPPFAQGGPEQRPPFAQGSSEQRPSFAQGGQEQRPPFAQGSSEQRPPFAQGNLQQRPPFAQGGPEQRPPFAQGGPEQQPPFAQGGPEQRQPFGADRRSPFAKDRLDMRAPFAPNASGRLDARAPFAPGVLGRPDVRPSFDESRISVGDPPAGQNDKLLFDGPMPFNRSRGQDQPASRGPIEEFCVGKQFNYNHGGGTVEPPINEIIPAKVIDYAHATPVPVHEYLTPAQCFDYGHGNLKPVVPEHEIFPKRDFRNWEETEQNLKEYDDKMKLYGNEYHLQERPRSRDHGRQEKALSMEQEWPRDQGRSYEREDRRMFDRDGRSRRDNRDREERRDRDRAREDRDREMRRERDREDRSRRDRSNSKDRNRERSDKNRKDPSKELNKDDDRSKGINSRAECLIKNNSEPSSQDSSNPEGKNDGGDNVPKKLELPKIPNYTMVDDLLCHPARQNRPPKIVIILRGPPGSGKSFVAKLIKDKEVEQGGSAPRILSLDDYFLVEKEKETKDDNGKKVTIKEMVYEYEEAMEQSYLTSLVKAFKKNITDGYFNFIILDCINEKISDYEEMWSFAKTKGFQVYVCEMDMDVQICTKRNVHNRTEDEINKIVDYFEPTPNYHLKLDVNSILQDEAIEEVHMEDTQQSQEESALQINDDSQDSQEDTVGVSKWERMDADNKLDRLDGLAKRKNEARPQTMEDFLQVPDYYNMEDDSGKKRVRWADLEERKEQEKLRAVGFVVGHTNWDRMMDPTNGQSALTRTKYI